MSAGRICVREVDTASVDENAWTAAERMHQRAVGTLVVLNEARRPVGILTDRDLVERVLAAGRDPGTTLVGDVMTRNPQTIQEDDSIESSLSRMRSGRFRRLPVLDRAGTLVGLLSLDDVIMLLAEEFAHIGGLLERETPCGIAADSTRV
jgi:CBS domain-containing protein